MAGHSVPDLTTSTCNMEEDHDLSASLLNHNVSFSSTMATSSMEMSLPKLSVTLSEAEKLKLKLQMNNASVNTTAAMETSQLAETSLEEEEDEEDESDRIIAIDDTMEVTTPTNADPLDGQQAATEQAIAPPPIKYFQGRLIELGRRCWSSSADAQHYTKGCYWSPDGTCLLVPVHLDGMHVMELPADLYSTLTMQTTGRDLTKLQSAVHVPEGGTVYDCAWYPHMNSQQPESCFWLATRQHEPIHMWDAFDGSRRCSYSGYDAVDEVMAAISLAFSADGQRIFAGYKRCIKIFDTSRPGRICDDYPVKFAISCIAQTSDNPNTLTCGNWHGYIQHFDLRCSPKQGPLFTLGGHKGGITQLRYSEAASGESYYLFSGARKCGKLLQWDMRNYKAPLAEFRRNVDTNQRIQFDLTAAGPSWLLSGDTKGALNLWNMDGDQKVISLPLHEDCCNGTALNPMLPILATSSGQYHFIGTDPSDLTMNVTETAVEPQVEDKLQPEQEVIYENAVVMWWCGPSAPN